jgi:adenosylhomocysteine nucleosidase
MRLEIFSAFPQELKHMRENLKIIESLRKGPFNIFFAEYSSKEVVLVQTGMNIHNANPTLEYILEEHCPDLILSLGFGGALYDGALVGDLVWASRVVFIPEGILEGETHTFLMSEGEETFYRHEPYILEVPGVREIVSRLSKVTMHEGCILTLERWMKKSEIKNIITQELSRPVCDMETFPLAKLSMQRGLPFFAVRSITDQADEEIPLELLDISDESGNYRFSRALRLIVCKPKLIPDIIKLGRNSKIASKNLWHVVESLLEIL